MKNLMLPILLASTLSSVPASAANRYLYFMASEGGTEKVLNVYMEPIYSRVFKGGDTFSCVYKHKSGAVSKLEFEGPQCSGDMASLTMRIEGKTTEGRKMESISTVPYVDHKYILLSGELAGLVDNQNPVTMAVASATNYAKLQGDGSEGPPIASVPTVAVGSPTDAERAPVGTLACWLEHRQYHCR